MHVRVAEMHMFEIIVNSRHTHAPVSQAVLHCIVYVRA